MIFVTTLNTLLRDKQPQRYVTTNPEVGSVFTTFLFFRKTCFTKYWCLIFLQVLKVLNLITKQSFKKTFTFEK